jgi:hypothetical protein
VPMRYAMGLADAGRRPVALAAAFGKTGSGGPSPSRASAAPEKTERDSRPSRTGRPRTDILGTWNLAQRVARSDGEVVDFHGFMFLGENDLGLIAIMAKESKRGRVVVLPIQTHTATRDGRIAITTGGLALDGYQTDEGLYLEGETTGERGSMAFAGVGTPGEIPLSNSSGLYDVEASTFMHYEDLAPTPMRWTGEAAVVVANDSVYIDLFMTNQSGGTTSATGGDALRKGRFSIATDNDDHLTGSLVDGRLRFKWKDVWDWGHYEGTVTGRRK